MMPSTVTVAPGESGEAAPVPLHLRDRVGDHGGLRVWRGDERPEDECARGGDRGDGEALAPGATLHDISP